MAIKLVHEIRELASLTAERYEPLANPLRIIILYIISALGEARWSDVKLLLENILGRVNPNTLSFHLKKLIEAGLIVKTGAPEDPRYMAEMDKLPSFIKSDLEEGTKKVGLLLREVRKSHDQIA